jgi:hypothetical protein
MHYDKDLMLRQMKRKFEEYKADELLKAIQMDRCANCLQLIERAWWAHTVFYGDESGGEAETIANYCTNCISVDTSRKKS